MENPLIQLFIIVLENLPRLLLFSGLNLLLISWIEIISVLNFTVNWKRRTQIRIFTVLNGILYLVQLVLWAILFLAFDTPFVDDKFCYFQDFFFVVLNAIFIVLFAIFGVKLLIVLRRSYDLAISLNYTLKLELLLMLLSIILFFSGHSLFLSLISVSYLHSSDPLIDIFKLIFYISIELILSILGLFIFFHLKILLDTRRASIADAPESSSVRYSLIDGLHLSKEIGNNALLERSESKSIKDRKSVFGSSSQPKNLVEGENRDSEESQRTYERRVSETMEYTS
jgi:hypothetical protein